MALNTTQARRRLPAAPADHARYPPRETNSRRGVGSDTRISDLDIDVGRYLLLQPLDLARRIVDVLADRKATDVVLLDIRPVASFADYFVICSGTSERQMQALAEAVAETLELEGTKPVQVEGTVDSGWILMDYGDVIVHIFFPQSRDYYRLERIWGQAPPIVRVQ